MENLSQNEQIRQHLEAGNTITPLEALSLFGCLRLGARIHNLKAAGMAIYSRLIEQNGKRFAEYSIEGSECHSRTRYNATAKLMESLQSKTATIAVIAFVALSSCATQKPGSASLHKSVALFQQAQQYQASRSSNKDGLRSYHNWDRRPNRMTRLPLTNWYIF